MPLFASPRGRHRRRLRGVELPRVSPALGTMDDLAELAADLRAAGIRLVVDFIFNHTSNEHEWARRAKPASRAQDFYLIFPDRTCPTLRADLREIFPDRAATLHLARRTCGSGRRRGSGRRSTLPVGPELCEPAVFRAMPGEMLFLANQGVEVLRMDAVAFIWKRARHAVRDPARGAPRAARLQRGRRMAPRACCSSRRRSSTRTRWRVHRSRSASSRTTRC